MSLKWLSNASTSFAKVLDPNDSVEELFKAQVVSPAKEFPFQLDVFQMQAIICLESGHNVLVAAHTSAGKTVVADYAIAKAFRSMSRVIYTSPIKALSNQKYRDFKKEFDEVGLLTGDVQIDTDSKCLIMTTEILLQMLYNRTQIIDDLECVVFDECHYVNDPERGHVWEEVFILLPKNCKLVLLSATVPNVVQFADWLGRARDEPTFVVITSKRPVPLQHFLYVSRANKSKDQRFMIVGSDGKFINDNYKEAEVFLKERKGEMKKCPQTERNIYLNLIRHLEERDELPVICFTLSRNRCDSNLENLMVISKDLFKLTTNAEESRIRLFVGNHLVKLKPCDRKLPQILRTVEMLERGLGVHHSGILPILKEITEILFSEGLVKVLVATETFAMGVNMPARTVVFDAIDKHDGNNWRDLKPSEYIQMAGRAGRRGKDKTGNVLILCKYDIPDSPRLVRMMQGSATELTSQFRLTYHMICNLHKTAEMEESKITRFLERSFGEHNRLKQTLEVEAQINAKKVQIEALPNIECDQCSDIEAFYKALVNYWEISEKIMPIICRKAQEKNKLNAGSIVVISTEDNPFEVAVVLKVNRTNNDISHLTVLSGKDTDHFRVRDIQIKYIFKILTKNFGKKFDSKSIISENEKKSKHKEETIRAIVRLRDLGLKNDFTLLSVDFVDPKKSLQIKDIDLVQDLDRFIACGQNLKDFKCIECNDFVKHFGVIKHKMVVIGELDLLYYKQSEQSLQFLPEYYDRIKVLKHLGYLDEDLRLLLKGRIACLMSEHELVITELLMNNLLEGLIPEEVAALFSAFVFQYSKSKECQERDQSLSSNLKKKRDEIIKMAEMVAIIERDHNVPESAVQPDINYDLLPVVYDWAKGKSFVEVLNLTDVQEGIIVRCIQRLDELLKFIRMAAKLMGNSQLEETVESASQVIKRDIVFCPSLYTIAEQSSENKENDETIDESLSSNFLCVLLTGEQLFGKPIECIKGTSNGRDAEVPDKVVNSFCWVEGTFTLPKALLKAIDKQIPAPGIEQFYEKDEVLEHSYYQWVCVVLFLQALCFYVTRLLWKGWEKGKISHLINDLNKVILKASEKTSKCDTLTTYLVENRGRHNAYAFRYFICEVLNFANVIIQMVFINWFLGGEFSQYGINVLNYLDRDPAETEDPMARAFPKLTKCTFRHYGPSGDVKRFDNLCLLPQNILNEKVYIMLWFWLYILVILSGVMVIYRLVIMAFPQSRYFLLHRFHHLVPNKYFETILSRCSYGDWFVMFLLGKNLDAMHYRDVIIQLSEKLDELPAIQFPDEYDAIESKV